MKCHPSFYKLILNSESTAFTSFLAESALKLGETKNCAILSSPSSKASFEDLKWKLVSVKVVKALQYPPWSLIKSMYSLSSGYFLLPWNSICSRKWAVPACVSGSRAAPTPTFRLAAAFSLSESWIRKILSLFESSNALYFLSSARGWMIFSLFKYKFYAESDALWPRYELDFSKIPRSTYNVMNIIYQKINIENKSSLF